MKNFVEVLIVTSKSPGWSTWTAVYTNNQSSPKFVYDTEELANYLSTLGSIESIKTEKIQSVSSIQDFITLLQARERRNTSKGLTVMYRSDMAIG